MPGGVWCVFVRFQNPVKQAPEMQSSTAELITGLVQLVPLTNSTQLSQEAMEVSISTNTHPSVCTSTELQGYILSIFIHVTGKKNQPRFFFFADFFQTEQLKPKNIYMNQ